MGFRSPDGRSFQKIQFSSLISLNGFTKISELLSVLSERTEAGEVRHHGARQLFDHSAFSEDEEGRLPLSIEGSTLTQTGSRGKLSTKGREAVWDLKWETAEPETLAFHPAGLRALLGIRENALSLFRTLRVEGETRIDAEARTWKGAPGNLLYRSGQRAAALSIWMSAPELRSEDGSTLSIEAYASSGEKPFRSRSWPSFRVLYGSQTIWFRGFLASFRTRSEEHLTEWTFECEKGSFSLRGKLQARTKSLLGGIRENTNGSLLFSAYDPFATLSVQAYRGGKLERSFQGFASLEHRSNVRNAYVPYSL